MWVSDVLPIAETSPYVIAGIGLAGSLIGGAIAATVSLVVAGQARDAAERSWIRDNRRETYDRLLTDAQRLLIACEVCMAERSEATEQEVHTAYVDFFDAYGVIQTVAEVAVVDAVRVYAYRLGELRAALDADGVLPPERFARVAQLVRRARHDVIDAMRADLGLTDSARPPEAFNPFTGTDLAGEYGERMAGARPRR